MKFSALKVNSIYLRYLVPILACYILFGTSQNLLNHSPWYDEAMQFWISFGCEPDEITMSNGIVDVIKLNQRFNHDPGGFSLLLHIWLKISHGIVWIRVLPLLLFFGSIALVYLTVQSLFKDRLISFLCCLTPFLSDALLYYSTEIRAYSMECLCSSFAVMTVCLLPQKSEPKKIFWLSVALCLFMTSRYSAMIQVAFAMLVVALVWFYRYKSKAVKKVLLMLIPFCAFSGLIFFFSLNLQNPSAKIPNYVDLSFQFDVLNAIVFFTPPILLLFFFRIKEERLFSVSLYVTFLNFGFLSLAALEMHPAEIRSKYCIGMLFGNLFFYTLIFGRLLNSFKHPTKHAIALTVVSTAIFLQHGALRMRHEQDFFDTEELSKLSHKKVYIHQSLAPVVRFLLTFGEARDWGIDRKNDLYYQKQTSHVIGPDGLFLRDHRNKNSKVDFSAYDILITSNQISSDSTSQWMKKSNHFYVKR